MLLSKRSMASRQRSMPMRGRSMAMSTGRHVVLRAHQAAIERIRNGIEAFDDGVPQDRADSR